MRKLLIKDVPALSYATEEAINRLRVNLNFLGNDIRKIMIISSSENEGKSFVAMHLWRQMAESGTHSILVDVDLRKSVMAQKYQMEPADGGEIRGTSHVLADAAPLEKAVFHTELEQGDILPNTENVVNPTMLLEGKYFQDMLEELENSRIPTTVIGFREHAAWAVNSDIIEFVDLEDIPGVFREPLPRIDLENLPDEGAWLQPFRSLMSLLKER